MSTFWQTVIPPALATLIAGRIAWTRTSRLLRTINTNLDLLDRLPADHPKRAMLEDRNGELLDLLVRRQQRRFGPFTEAGVSFGFLAGVAAVAFAFAGLAALMAFGVIPLIAGGCTVAAVRAARQQHKEHPPAVQQPTEAG